MAYTGRLAGGIRSGAILRHRVMLSVFFTCMLVGLAPASAVSLRGSRALQQSSTTTYSFEGSLLILGTKYALYAGGPTAFGLIFEPGTLPSTPLTAGMRLRVTGYWQSGSMVVTKPVVITLVTGSFQEANAGSTGSNSNGYSTQPQSGEVSTLTMFVHLCGKRPTYSRAAYEVQMFGSSTENGPASTTATNTTIDASNCTPVNTKANNCSGLNGTTTNATDSTSAVPVWEQSVQNYYRQCSFGKMSMPMTKNIIVKQDVYVRGGVCSRINTMCDYNAIETEALEYTKTVLGYDIDAFKHHIFILPAGTACKDFGVGDLGCIGNRCSVWFQPGVGGGVSWKNIAHELGHNYGLGHAQADGQEYGDRASPMGSGLTCHNVPQGAKLGWYDPLAQLDVQDYAAGISYTLPYVLPPRASRAKNHIMVIQPGVTLYLSFLANSGFERSWSSEFKDKVVVEVEGDDGKSNRVGVIGLGQRWPAQRATSFPAVYITVSRVNAAGATVLMCRATAAHHC